MPQALLIRDLGIALEPFCDSGSPCGLLLTAGSAEKMRKFHKATEKVVFLVLHQCQTCLFFLPKKNEHSRRNAVRKISNTFTSACCQCLARTLRAFLVEFVFASSENLQSPEAHVMRNASVLLDVLADGMAPFLISRSNLCGPSLRLRAEKLSC